MTPIQELDRIIRRRHLLKHPFYVAWSRGDVALSTLRDYAGQYYHFESNFPRYLAGTYARLQNVRDRRQLLENLTDEEGRSPTHPDLWIDFARALGVPKRAVDRSRPNPSTRRLLRTYETLTLNGSATSGLGALYAYESIFPEIAAEKSRGLREKYGIRSREAHEFFRVHTHADIEHARAERGILAREMARSARSTHDAEVAVRRTTEAWWKFLDGFAC